MALDAAEVKCLGREAGFELVRIGPAGDLGTERDRYLEWIAAGRQADMGWITPERAEKSASPRAVLPGAQSVISVGLSYWGGLRPADGRTEGRIARYAWGRDYHAVLGERLVAFAEALRARGGSEQRWYVDTGPAMDKALAARSGLGWQGKNTNILTERFGSFVLLGEIFTTLALEPDQSLARDCGSCRLCIVACPTGALGPEYSIDSRRCISYLTIEHRGPIPLELRPLIGRWVFGCDICQDVCPPSVQPFLRDQSERRTWAAEVRAMVKGAGERTPETTAGEGSGKDGLDCLPLYQGGIRPTVDLLWLLRLTHQEYLDGFRGTAVRRAKVWMLRRNAAVALGNVGEASSIPELIQALRDDEHPIVRGHAAWAVGQIGVRTGIASSLEALRASLARESDPSVLEEIDAAVAAVGVASPAGRTDAY